MSDDKRKALDEYFIKIKKALATDEGLAEFKERLNKFYSVVQEYDIHPLEHNIMSDAFMCFFSIDQVESQIYLEGGIESKMQILSYKRDKGELLGFDEMVNRCLGFADILFHSGGRLRQPIYLQAANRMLYVLTGTDAVLDQVGNSIYIFPDYEKKEEPSMEDRLIPEDEHEGVLYQ